MPEKCSVSPKITKLNTTDALYRMIQKSLCTLCDTSRVRHLLTVCLGSSWIASHLQHLLLLQMHRNVLITLYYLQFCKR
jgi:hypothetical protein